MTVEARVRLGDPRATPSALNRLARRSDPSATSAPASASHRGEACLRLTHEWKNELSLTAGTYAAPITQQAAQHTSADLAALHHHATQAGANHSTALPGQQRNPSTSPSPA